MIRRIDRTGERRIMNNGLMAEVIAYRNNRDIDVKFPNGEIAEHRMYWAFCEGQVSAPMHIEIHGNFTVVENPNTGFRFKMDTCDLPLLSDTMWCENVGGYAYNTKLGYLHRLIVDTPRYMETDHVNGDKADNRKSNLRICLHVDNVRNVGKQVNNSSGFKGVSWNKQRSKWVARISVDGKNMHLGSYAMVEQAAKAYDEAAIKYHGEFARLNIGRQ